MQNNQYLSRGETKQSHAFIEKWTIRSYQILIRMRVPAAFAFGIKKILSNIEVLVSF